MPPTNGKFMQADSPPSPKLPFAFSRSQFLHQLLHVIGKCLKIFALALKVSIRPTSPTTRRTSHSRSLSTVMNPCSWLPRRANQRSADRLQLGLDLPS
eukprot:3961836-Pleurochrysis_carterae.AAC.1